MLEVIFKQVKPKEFRHKLEWAEWGEMNIKSMNIKMACKLKIKW